MSRSEAGSGRGFPVCVSRRAARPQQQGAAATARVATTASAASAAPRAASGVVLQHVAAKDLEVAGQVARLHVALVGDLAR